MSIIKRKYGKHLITAALAMCSFVMIMPFIMMVSTSLKTPAEINSPSFTWIPRSWEFSNYVTAMTSGDWITYLFNSMYVTLTVTVVSLFFNSLAGYAFARLQFKFKNILFISILLSLMMPHQLFMIPVFVIMKHIPFAGGNDFLGMGGTGWINTYAGLMINQMAGAFGIFLARQYYISFPKDLDEAAEIDGCSVWGTYFRVFLPLSGPLLATLGIIKATMTWNDYLWPLIITNSEELRTVQLALAMFKNDVIQWELLMAATTVVSLPLLLLFLFAQKLFLQSELSSSVKG